MYLGQVNACTDEIEMRHADGTGDRFLPTILGNISKCLSPFDQFGGKRSFEPPEYEFQT